MQNKYYPNMCRWMLLSGAFFAACTTKENPAAKCSTGTCTDPAAPFCDVDGSVGGTAGSCLAVACTAGEFKSCRGDVALTCNSMGNNYDELLCQKGCTPAAMGCKLCDPGQTLCTNGEVQTCDSNGQVTNAESCALGCFEDQPRCRDVDPSNALGQYADMATSPPDVVLMNGDIDTATGTVTDNGVAVAIPNYDVSAATGGVPIRVFVVNSLNVHNATVRDKQAGQSTGTGYAVAFVAKGDIVIDGTFTIAAGTGAYVQSGCNGANGSWTDRGNEVTAAAGGGGANATDGARGGNVTVSMGGVLEPGGGKGTASGTATLIPLRGGCPGGASTNSSFPNPNAHGSFGGGAVQLTSATQILVNGSIDTRGALGGIEQFQGSTGEAGLAYGGGAGGGILLEAPHVKLGASATLLATGGDGGALCTANMNGCGVGGHGATAGLIATQGTDIVNFGPSVYAETAGGGGGGVGRIRINTVDQTYTKSNTTVEDGLLTVGTVSTR